MVKTGNMAQKEEVYTAVGGTGTAAYVHDDDEMEKLLLHCV